MFSTTYPTPAAQHVVAIRPATDLAHDLPISPQAVTQHLRALRDAGPFAPERSGRDVRYVIRPAPLTAAASWMATEGGQWDERLGALAMTLPEFRAG